MVEKLYVYDRETKLFNVTKLEYNPFKDKSKDKYLHIPIVGYDFEARPDIDDFDSDDFVHKFVWSYVHKYFPARSIEALKAEALNILGFTDKEHYYCFPHCEYYNYKYTTHYEQCDSDKCPVAQFGEQCYCVGSLYERASMGNQEAIWLLSWVDDGL